MNTAAQNYCYKCKELLCEDNWGEGCKRNKKYLCKKCHVASNAKWQQENIEKTSWVMMKHRYGISKEEWEQMFKDQHGNCAICKKPLSLKRSKVYVDHDHLNKRVRGLLDPYCNTLMAGVDNEAWLKEALAYRDRYRKPEEPKVAERTVEEVFQRPLITQRYPLILS